MDITTVKARMAEVLIEVADKDLDQQTILQHKDDIKYIGLHSIIYIRFFSRLEDEFDMDIEIDVIDAETLYSLDKLAGYIVAHLS